MIYVLGGLACLSIWHIYETTAMRNRYTHEIMRIRGYWHEAIKSSERRAAELDEMSQEVASLRKQARQAIEARDRCAEVLARKLRTRNES